MAWTQMMETETERDQNKMPVHEGRRHSPMWWEVNPGFVTVEIELMVVCA